MSDVSEQAKALARAVWPYVERHSKWHTYPAQRAIDVGWVHRDSLIAEGWTPPPDPHEDIARELWAALADMWPVGTVWQPHRSKTQADLLALVRRMFPDADEAWAIAGRIEEGT